MDELELAKKAVRRGLLSEDQLREARVFAEGGRSLLAVLLDLGYLHAPQVLELNESSPPPPPAPRRSGTAGWLLVTVAVGILGLVIGRGCASRTIFRAQPVYVRESAAIDAPAPPTPLGRTLQVRANEIIAAVEDRARREAGLSPESEASLDRAAALLEESLLPGAFLPRDSHRHALFSLGRAQELLGRWESALASFNRALKEHTGFSEAHLGAARCRLLLRDTQAAFQMADEACARWSGIGEPFLIRAKARIAMGDLVKARADLLSARGRDASLAPEVERLLSRLDEPR